MPREDQGCTVLQVDPAQSGQALARRPAMRGQVLGGGRGPRAQVPSVHPEGERVQGEGEELRDVRRGPFSPPSSLPGALRGRRGGRGVFALFPPSLSLGRGLVRLRPRGGVSGAAEARRPRSCGPPGLVGVGLLRRPVGGPKAEPGVPRDGEAHLLLAPPDPGEEGHHRGVPHRGLGVFLCVEEEERAEGVVIGPGRGVDRQEALEVPDIGAHVHRCHARRHPQDPQDPLLRAGGATLVAVVWTGCSAPGGGGGGWRRVLRPLHDPPVPLLWAGGAVLVVPVRTGCGAPGGGGGG